MIFLCAAAVAQQLSFEVVSIKPAAPSAMNQIQMRQSSDPGMVRYSNFALRDLIRIAFRVKDFQVEGPEWMDSTRFEFQGKLPAGASEDQAPEMLQAALAERFKLAVHRETKDHAIFALVAAKGGPKLKTAENPVPDGAVPGRGGRGGRGSMRVEVDESGAHLKASSVTLAGLAEMLSRFSERPIVDMSGITGQYDFDLVLSPEALQAARGGARTIAPAAEGGAGRGPADAASSGPGTIHEAVQKYGLRLEARKAPMEMVVVDHVEKTPTEN